MVGKGLNRGMKCEGLGEGIIYFPCKINTTRVLKKSWANEGCSDIL